MSNYSLSNAFLDTMKREPGLGRATAKGELIARHNYKGETVFRARRLWHTSRAGTEAARRRLTAALAEMDDAHRREEEAELRALRAMGIGASLPKRPATVPRVGRKNKGEIPPSPRSAAAQGRRTTTGGSRLRPGRVFHTGDIVDTWKNVATNKRDEWRLKMEKQNAAHIARQTAAATASIEFSKPKRGGKAGGPGLATT